MRYSPLCCGVLVPVGAGARGVVSASFSIARCATCAVSSGFRDTGEESTRERRATSTSGRLFARARAVVACAYAVRVGWNFEVRALSSRP